MRVCVAYHVFAVVAVLAGKGDTRGPLIRIIHCALLSLSGVGTKTNRGCVTCKLVSRVYQSMYDINYINLNR